MFVICQGSLEVKPSGVIGSFLVKILPFGAGKFKICRENECHNKLLTNLAFSRPKRLIFWLAWKLPQNSTTCLYLLD